MISSQGSSVTIGELMLSMVTKISIRQTLRDTYCVISLIYNPIQHQEIYEKTLTAEILRFHLRDDNNETLGKYNCFCRVVFIDTVIEAGDIIKDEITLIIIPRGVDR